MRTQRVLAVRADGLGDVLLCEPAIRAVAERASQVTMLCSAAGEPAARLLTSVDRVLVHECPWIAADPPPVSPAGFARLIDDLAGVKADVAIVFTSDRQSALPMALALRLAGVPRIAAYSEHYPGSLLDVRLRPHEGRSSPPPHEVERNIALIEAAGFDGPQDRSMRVRHTPIPPAVQDVLPARYIVVHAGSSVPARSMGSERWRHVVDALLDDRAGGHGQSAGDSGCNSLNIVLTGSDGDETAIRLAAETVGREGVVDLVGATSFGELGAVFRRADAICVGNTGALHLASAVGTPVVACFPVTVPPARWGPWGGAVGRVDQPDALRPLLSARVPVGRSPLR